MESSLDNFLVFKTDNFNRYGFWVKRLFFCSAFGFLVHFNFLASFDFGTIGNSISLAVLFLIFIAGQVDELEINEFEIIVSQRSIVPFLRSIRSLKIKEIQHLRTNSNYVEGLGIWSFILKKRRSLELILDDGKTEIINSKLHPEGMSGLRNEIESRLVI